MKPSIMKNRGVVLLTTMIMLALIAMVGAGMAIIASRDLYTVKRQGYSTQAYFLAEAGIEEAIDYIYNNGFLFGSFPMEKGLGNGSFEVTLDTTQYDTDRLVLIESTGTVNEGEIDEVSRNMSVLVKDTSPSTPAFDYLALSGGKMQFFLRTEVTGDVHSNSTAHPTKWWHYIWPICVNYHAMYIGLLTNISGTASACGEIYNLGGATIEEGADQVPLPPFDADFFNYYYELADAENHVYIGDKLFSSAPEDGVHYATGNVTLAGTWTFTGCIVAGGNIQINPGWSNRNGEITQHQSGNYPALMSINGTIGIYESTTLNGLVYAGGGGFTVFDFIQDSDITITGACVSQGDMVIKGGFLWGTTYLNYDRPNPPGLGGGASPLEVICWGG